MCASPGNKTTHIAQLMGDTGILIALDKSKNRIDVLKRNIQRFNLKSVHVYACDATKVISKHSKDDWSPPFTEEKFDKILLDAPCSGLGNRPVLTTKLRPNDLLSFPKLQKKLLDTAVRLLKINGVLVYSTCSVMGGNNTNIRYDSISLKTYFAEFYELEHNVNDFNENSNLIFLKGKTKHTNAARESKMSLLVCISSNYIVQLKHLEIRSIQKLEGTFQGR